jgi:ABC-2 type transport system permease protein
MVLAAKEFKGYFSSWLAYIFIAIFVLASAVTFFYLDPFFSNGRAEIRGFFAWLPLTLAILVPGLTMRQWARENEMGSIELLMTLPAKTRELVMGKFLGTLGFVAVALLFTLGIPITAEIFGDLDWGPVIGGYAAAVLLGAVYVAIGLFVSSCFNDQFPALLVGWLLCAFLAAMSHDVVLGWARDLPAALSESMRFLGLWDRFRAIERGVLDFRDVAYYLTAIAAFLYLNICRLRSRRYA